MYKNKILPAALALSFSLLLTACGGDSGSPTTAQEPAAAPTSAAPAVDKAAEVKLCEEVTTVIQKSMTGSASEAMMKAMQEDIANLSEAEFMKKFMSKIFADMAKDLKAIEPATPDSPVASTLPDVIKETEALAKHDDPENADETAFEAAGSKFDEACADAGFVAPEPSADEE